MLTCPHCHKEFDPPLILEESTKRGRRLPEDWEPSDKQIAWAKARRPDVDFALQATLFRNYWCSKSGADATKRNWNATFENWILQAKGAYPKAGAYVSQQASAPKPQKRIRENPLTPEQREENRKRMESLIQGLGK